jgi:transcription initiation factor TFIIIB Brf1 subunit/transcription initiation factor TFIIB
MYRKVTKPDSPKNAVCPECGCKRLLYQGGKLKCTDCAHIIGATFNKYGAKKTQYAGHRYDSKFEAQIAEDLDTRLKGKDIKAVERQIKIPLEAYGTHIFNYIIDFVITHNDDSKEYLEVKGYETDLWKTKWKIFEAKMNLEDPSAVLTVLKQNSYRKY